MNYFHYFSEIEERFARRRGSLLMLSTLDWALIETWREAGVPLEAVLRGIDDAFDKHDAKRSRAGARARKVNGLAWCAQAVMVAAEAMQEAAIGMHVAEPQAARESGLEAERVAQFLESNAEALEVVVLPGAAAETAAATALRLRSLAAMMRAAEPMPLDELDRTLTVLEERLLAAVTHAAPEAEIVAMRGDAHRELTPYRGKLRTEQLRTIQQQFLVRRLLQMYGLPRLSLFYMSVAE